MTESKSIRIVKVGGHDIHLPFSLTYHRRSQFTDFFSYSPKLHRMNLPAHVIQEFFGWASSEMLQIYNDLTAEDEFGKYFTKDGVKEIKQGSLTDI